MAQRDLEVEAVMAAFADSARDAVVLYGHAGVGKSRLADTCVALAGHSGRLTARVMASHAAAVLPLGALAPILPSGLPPDATPAALFEQALTELRALGGGEGLVLYVDDAHLLDTSSAVLLTQLLDARALFLVATIRNGEPLPDAVASWWRRGTTERLDLSDLSMDGTREVLTLALGGVVAAATTRRLHLASGGNPLLLRELVHQAVEDGQLSDESGTWQIAGEIAPSRRMGDVLAVRLAALREPARRIVEQLAVCAPLAHAELTGENHDRAAGEGGADGPADHVPLDEIDVLVKAGLVRILVDGHRHQLVLAHPLYGEALRAELSVLRRRNILLVAADRVEALGARRREDALRVATWRLDAGGTLDRGLLLQAARFARYTHDFSQVVRLAQILWAEEPTLQVGVLLGEAHYELGHGAEAEAVLAAEVTNAGDEGLLVQRATLRCQNLHANLFDWAGALAVAQEARTAFGSEHAEDLAAQEAQLWCSAALPQKALDVVAGMEPDTVRGRVVLALVRGQALCRVGHTAEAIEVAIEGYREHCTLLDPLAVASPGIHFVNQAFSLLEAGRFREADELAMLGYDGAVAQNLPFGQVYLTMVLGRSCLQQGRIQDAQRWFQEGASTAHAHGFLGPESFHRSALAATDAMLGHGDAASAGLAAAAHLPVNETLRYQSAIGQGWTAWVEGDLERARSILVTSATEAAATSNVGIAAWLWHDAARLGARDVGGHLVDLAGRGDSPSVDARAGHVQALEADDAEALGAASGVFEDLGMMLLAAEASFSAAATFRRDGDQRSGARWANRGESLAARCQGAVTPGLAFALTAVPLSSREREVAMLARSGLSSQAIADRLFISIRTVNNHLAHAYDKLGVSGRDELAELLGP